MKGLIISHLSIYLEALQKMFPLCETVDYRDADAEFFRDRIEDYRYIVLSGGPIEISPPHALVEEKAFLRRTDKPVLGVCLGHQILCIAYGAKLLPMGWTRKGFEDYTFFGNPGKMWYMHSWHIQHAPDVYTVQAEANGIVECVTHKDKPFLGVQGHPEMAGPFGESIRDYFLHTFAGLSDK